MASAFTRLAGIQDATRSEAASPQPPQPSTLYDPESQSIHTTTTRPSRSSVPLNRRNSRKSTASLKSRTSLSSPPDVPLPPLPPAAAQAGVIYSATKSSLVDRRPDAPVAAADDSYLAAGAADPDSPQEPEGEGETPWGPSHPCFPHPNPHVPTSDPTHSTTRIIRVRRDWLVAGDEYPQFQNVYPEILAEWLSEEEFRAFIDELNGRLRAAFRPDSWRAVVDAIMGVVSGWVWDDLGLTGAKAGVKGLESWFEEWNAERERRGTEIRVIQLRRTGFMNLDFVVPDPGIDLVDEEGQEVVEGQGEGR